MKKKLKLLCFSRGSLIKIYLKMKLLAFLMFLALSVSAADSYSQSVTFNLKLKNVAVKEVFDLIEEESEFILLYNEKWVNVDRHVDIKVKNGTVEDVLKQAFKGTRNEFRISDRQIVIVRNDQAKVSEELFSPHSEISIMQQQPNVVKGKVTDPDNKPLPGATITIVGTTRGVITDNDGSFSIEANPSDKLVFSFVGFESQIIDVRDQKTINIQMAERIDELEEVTVVAFGKQKKESVISSIETIKTEDLRVPSSNLTTAFAGRMSGMISYQRSGEPGQDNAQFFIRGVTSFGTGKVDPLILIDNIEMTTDDLSRLHPDDIASFSILKDATGTAVYGARGANGIILITTKEGREGKLNVSVRVENSFSSPTQQLELADPITYMKMANEAAKTRDPLSAIPYSREKIDNTIRGVNPYVYPSTDWMDVLFKDVAINQKAHLNITGGGKMAQYYISGSFAQDNGILKVDKNNNCNCLPGILSG